MIKNKKTQEKFVEEINTITNGDYIVLGEYKGKRVKVRLRHCFCNYEWEVTPDNFIYQGTRCPNCAKVKTLKNLKSKGTTKLNNEEFLLKVKNKFGAKFVILTDYNPDKVKVRHECGYEYETTPRDFLRKRTDKCLNCIPNKSKTHSEFVKEIKNLVKDEYTILSEYKGNRAKIKIKHEICGSVWEAKPTLFLHNGNRCPECNESKGEKRIRNHLERKNINFESQKAFEGLTGIRNRSLKFDFAILDSLDNIIFLIEYDGEFHFKKQYKEDNYEMLVEHDQRKNEYCKNNNISLLRIPYWDFDNIEDILLKLFNNIKI